TKIEAGKIATASGVHMVIAPGAVDNPLQAIAAGGPCTWFLAPGNPVTARKRWIAGSLEPKGNLVIDAGAAAALRSGKNLLPAGGRQAGRGRVLPRRRGDRPRSRRTRDRARALGLRRRRCGENSRQVVRRHRADPRVRRPGRDDPPRRSGATAGVRFVASFRGAAQRRTRNP